MRVRGSEHLLQILIDCKDKHYSGLKPSLSKLHAASGEPLQEEGKYHHLASKSQERSTGESGRGFRFKPGHHNLL